MADDIAIKVEHVSKSFKLPHERHTSLKSSLINFHKHGYEKQQVLKDINFEVKKGEFFGIVGRNGSGKSTLLKLLAGIYVQDEGEIKINGRLTPFIELGVGFNPELTGRENVFLNGALLGFNRKQMHAMYDDIVEFAELRKFMDQKLKNYSSGMQVRLAFSIAIQAKSEILVLDEVLAVGDEAFQRKCQDYFSQLKRDKQTVILVTHNMSAVEMFCSRALFLDDGQIKLMGNPNEVASAYSRENDEAIRKSRDHTDETKTGESITAKIVDDKNKPKKAFTSGESMVVDLKWTSEGVQHVGVAVYRLGGEYVYGTNTYIEHLTIPTGVNSIKYVVKLNLGEGAYFIKVGLFGENDSIRIDFEDRGTEFIVNREKDDFRWGGLTKLESTWKL